jgi:hypothetical protein
MDDPPIDIDAVIAELGQARDEINAAIRSGDRAAIIAAERRCEASLDELEHFGALGVTSRPLRELRTELTALLFAIQQLI